jgi:hypothetical protein
MIAEKARTKLKPAQVGPVLGGRGGRKPDMPLADHICPLGAFGPSPLSTTLVEAAGESPAARPGPPLGLRYPYRVPSTRVVSRRS